MSRPGLDGDQAQDNAYATVLTALKWENADRPKIPHKPPEALSASQSDSSAFSFEVGLDRFFDSKNENLRENKEDEIPVFSDRQRQASAATTTRNMK